MSISLLNISILLIRILTIQGDFIDDPTLKPDQHFSAKEDAETIRKEMKKHTIGRDEIAKIIFHRTYDERKQIDEYYNETFCQKRDGDKCPLHSALKDISTNSLDELYNIVLTPPEGILAQTVYDSIKLGDGEVGAIEEIICANDKEMKFLMNKFYQQNYQISIEDHLATFKSDDRGYQDVMIKYCWKGLCQDAAKITPEDADKAAQDLKDLDRKKDKEGFKKKLMELLDTTCEPDLKQIFEKYRHDKKGIKEGVEKAFDVERERRAYSVLVRYIENSCEFYAEQLHETVHSKLMMIQIHKINRIVLTRCERDLLSITKAYHDKYMMYGIIQAPEFRYLECIRYLCGKP